MKEIFDLTTVNIPYGVLHDQRLKEVKHEDKKWIFTFDIEVYPQDYIGDFYKTYQPYKHCDMVVECADDYCDCCLLSAVNSKGKFEGLEIADNNVSDVINNAPMASFIGCFADGNLLKIEFGINYYNAKGKYESFKNYCQCCLSLMANKLEWNWY